MVVIQQPLTYKKVYIEETMQSMTFPVYGWLITIALAKNKSDKIEDGATILYKSPWNQY